MYRQAAFFVKRCVCYVQEFKLRAHLARHVATAHGGGGEGARPVMKTRAAFYLRASPFTRLARRLARALRRPRHFARSPFSPINLQQVKHECEYPTLYSTRPPTPALRRV